MTNNQILSFQQIKALYKAGQVMPAYNALEKYLLSNGQDQSAIRLLNKIKSQILQENIKKINQAIHRFDYLYNEKKYKEILSAYLQIQKYAPDYIVLQKKIEKVYNLVLKDKNDSDNQEYQRIKLVVKSKLANNEFEASIHFIEQSIQANPNNVLTHKLLIETKRQIIDCKLKVNKKSLKQLDIPKVYDFIKSLYDLEPTYPKIQKLLIQKHNTLKEYFKNKKLAFQQDSVRQIKVLYNTKEFKKCIQACDELIRTNTYDATAFKYKKKAQQALVGRNFTVAYQKLEDYLKII
jgi:tetratricopeptide (TPR) repeat protein